MVDSVNIYTEILNLSGAGRPAVMATVIHKAGSSPRSEGARCLIADGVVEFGSVGGGLVEAEACGAAARVGSTGRPSRLFFDLNGTEAAEADMLCGGEMTLFLEPVSPVHPADVTLFERLNALCSARGSAVLVTVLDEDRWVPGEPVPRMLVEGGGRTTGGLGLGESIENVLAGDFENLARPSARGVKHAEDGSGSSVCLFIEPVISPRALYVFGGGHVSRALAPLAAAVDFEVVVIDDRIEYSKREDFPQAAEVLCVPFDEVVDRLDVDDSSSLVIATRGHVHDMTVLMQALRTGAGYIGMIGSSRKRGILFSRLLQEGFTREELDRVHTPVGIDIGAETPAEIAVSIVAELVRVRAGRPERRKTIDG